ncbi:WYL domain-containing protein [Methylocystis sp.]|uniref:WYL domain-containing protein n=1 Tax=Methylocystis sp. TaxID=1911079 RepID=UPI0025D8CC3B|nr:WYL domain-containing protein [Methylocystis sp.]
MQGQATTERSWGVEQRLEFIEFRLFWEGGINRSDITTFFGVSVPQASKDLSQYQVLAPLNISYDKREKRYLKTERFAPLFLKPDSDRYLSTLRSIADKTLLASETWIAYPPAAGLVPLPHRHVDPEMLRLTLDAVRGRKSIEIRYQSLSEKHLGPTWRWISPHAFAFDLHRWHVRAFCHIDRTFKDFLLARFSGIRDSASAMIGPDRDSVWNEIFTVILRPHPKLNENQRRAIAQDYCMEKEKLAVPMRLALLYYFVRRLDLDPYDEMPNKSEKERHVVLDNKDEVKAALERANSAPTIASEILLTPPSFPQPKLR